MTDRQEESQARAGQQSPELSRRTDGAWHQPQTASQGLPLSRPPWGAQDASCCLSLSSLHLKRLLLTKYLRLCFLKKNLKVGLMKGQRGSEEQEIFKISYILQH